MKGCSSVIRPVLLVASLVMLSCTADFERGMRSSGMGHIMSDICFKTAVSGTRASGVADTDTISVSEEIYATISSVAISRPSDTPTRSSLVLEMYDDFGFGIDEVGGSGKVVEVGIDNEKMTCSQSNSFVSSNKYQKEYICSGDGTTASFWGYAPYSEPGLTGIRDGERVLDLTIDDPMSEDDLIAMGMETNASHICISPIESELAFNHILSAVRFLYNGSAGVSGEIESIKITGLYDSGEYNLRSGTWSTSGNTVDLVFPLGLEFGPDDSSLELLGEDEFLLLVPQEFSDSSRLEIDYSLAVKQSGKIRKGTLKASLSSLGEWKPGLCVDYILSFKNKLQTSISSSVPDTLFWNWSEGQETVRKVYIQGENLDVSAANVTIGGNDSGHWSVVGAQYLDEGKTVGLSLSPVDKNSGDEKNAVLQFSYPDVPAAGSVNTVLVHRPFDSGKQIFAALKNPDWLESSDLGNGAVAVRPSREGKVYLYLNNDGLWGAQNILGSHGGKSENDWNADFDGLESEYGISCAYDESSRLLAISVSSTQKFLSHLGSIVELECKPVAGESVLKIVLKLMPDISIDGLDDFYVGMKRYPVVSGFCGDVTMKIVPSSSSGIIRYGSDRVLLESTPVSVQNLYAYKGGDVDIVFESADDFNDCTYTAELSVLDPVPVIDLSDSKLYVHGDEVTLKIRYDDKNGTEIPSSSFDPQSYGSLLSCDISAIGISGKHFLGTENYSFSKVDDGFKAFVCSIPEDYSPGMEYSAEIVATPAYDSSVHGKAETTVPAFDANGVSSCIATLDDYLSLNKDNSVSARSGCSFTYGVKSPDDLTCTVIPLGTQSCENDCITAAISAKDDGYITFNLSDPDPEDMLCTHSVGKHKVEVSTVNKHSGDKICRSDLWPYIDVNIHVTVGAGVYLTDYSEDNCVTAYIFGDALTDVGKCSIVQEQGANFVKPVSSDYSGDATIYNWNSLAIRADIEVEGSGTSMGQDYPYLVAKFSLNSSGATEQQIENAKTVINNVWNDETGKAFFSYGGLWGTVPRMSFYNDSKVSEEKLGEFYYVHTLENLNQTSRGWINVYYDIGMPHDGYPL